MRSVLLPNHFDSWIEIRDKLKDVTISKINDFARLFTDLNILIDIKSLVTLEKLQIFTEDHLCEIINEIIRCSLELPSHFPDGKIARLSLDGQILTFSRAQVLCLLSNMFMCLIKPSKENLYWVNFDIWLNDDRPCALCYIQTLLEYFKQAFFDLKCSSNSFKQQKIEFKRVCGDVDDVFIRLEECDKAYGQVDIHLDGSIGDIKQSCEVDFANRDIGYGKTGTQEEILFGSSPELCVAMLFCDSLNDNEAILLSGARRVANFNGYGLNLSIDSLVPIDFTDWTKREILAIDALDFSDTPQSSYQLQFQLNNLKRELVKAYVGFSSVKSESISTGYWGCGAFCGDRELKAIIQVIAVRLTHKNLHFYCFGREEFFEKFKKFDKFVNENKLTSKDLWNRVCSFDANTNTSIFNSFYSNR